MSQPSVGMSPGSSKRLTHYAYGAVDGFHYPNRLIAGRIKYVAAYVHTRQNDPTTVTLSVTSMPSRGPCY